MRGNGASAEAEWQNAAFWSERSLNYSPLQDYRKSFTLRHPGAKGGSSRRPSAFARIRHAWTDCAHFRDSFSRKHTRCWNSAHGLGSQCSTL